MADDVHRLFGDGVAADVVLWLIAAGAFVALVWAAFAWVWPRLRAFVKAAELFGGLPARFDAVDEAIAAVHRKIDTQAVVVERVRHQVENDHGTNLREDIDDLRDDLRGVKKDIGRADERDLTMTQQINMVDAKVEATRSEVREHVAMSNRWIPDTEKRVRDIEQTLNPKDRE